MGWGEIHLPEDHFPTVAAWWSLESPLPGSTVRTGAGLGGVAHVLGSVASLFLMCERRDLGVTPEVRDPRTGRPTLYLYDMVVGGVGLAEIAFRRGDEFFNAALERVRACPCEAGCPSCIGPGSDEEAKPAALEILERCSQAFRSEVFAEDVGRAHVGAEHANLDDRDPSSA